VTGGIALGYDGAVWFTQNNAYVTRFLSGVFTPVHINLAAPPNFFQGPAWPILTATSNGVYTGVDFDEQTGFAVEENIVKITYSRSVSVTSGVAQASPNAQMKAISSAGSAVYATGTFDNIQSTPPCTQCLYLISDSGKHKYMTTSYRYGEALAYFNSAVYVAAALTDSSQTAKGVNIYKFNPSTFSFAYIKTLTAPSNVLGMTAGPDGALWFTDSGRNAIGRLDTLGNVKEYALPTAHANPSGIASAADGALWFTETAADKIGRITTAGGITEYHVPTANAAPVGITALPVSKYAPRAVWFAETGSGKIGRLTY
jgi:streptogramin lyase